MFVLFVLFTIGEKISYPSKQSDKKENGQKKLYNVIRIKKDMH